MNDLRYAVRQLVKNPGFTFVALLVLTLAIGGNTAMFNIVNAIVLRPLSVKSPDELVGCYSKDKKPEGGYRAFSYPNYLDIREKNTVFTGLVAHGMAMVGVTEGALTRRAFTAIVSANYFSTFGVRLAAGREFTLEEEKPGSATPVVIVDYQYWKKLGADPDLIGTTIRVNNRAFTIIGVAPEYFTGTTALFSHEFWFPLGTYEMLTNDFINTEKRPLGDRKNDCLMLVGRLRPGLTAVAAQAQLEGLASQLEQAYPDANKDQTLVLSSLPRLSISTSPSNGDDTSVLSILLMSMSGVVLLIACLNLANMLLARGAARRKEFSIRVALGGGRTHIVRQLLTEGLLLSLLGGAAGMVAAYWGTKVLLASLVPRIPGIQLVMQTGPDWRVLAVTFGFCVLSTLIFGLGPAWKLSRANVLTGLKEQTGEDRRVKASGSIFGARNLLVIAQIALSLALLTAAGLFTRGAIKAADANPGFNMETGILAEVDIGLAGYDEVRGRQIYRTVMERLRFLPGVQSASLAYVVPFGLFSDGCSVQKTGAPAMPAQGSNSADSEKPVGAAFNIVSTDYFKTLGLPVLRGREFERLETESLTARRVVIIDEPLAQKLWPNEDPIGRNIQLVDKKENGKEPDSLEIVGLVPGVRNNLTDKTESPHVYVPFGQHYRSQANIHIKTSFNGHEADTAFLKTVRQELHAVDPNLPILSVQTLRNFRDEGLMLWFVRTGARLFTIFGSLALFLGVVGVYGVKAYVVARRTREIGVRMALGASKNDVLWMVLREGLRLTLVGLGLGLLLSLATGQVLSSMLYEVRGTDSLVLLTAPLLLAAAAMLACFFPARRAAKIEPMAALRCE